MATQNNMPEAQERELRLSRELDELVLAAENLEGEDFRRWFTQQGYLFPTQRDELKAQIRALQQGRGEFPLQTS